MKPLKIRKKNSMMMWKLTDFSYLGDRINSGGGCEVAVTCEMRLVWVRLENAMTYFIKKISSGNQRNCMQKLCEISNALWKHNMVPRPE